MYDELEKPLRELALSEPLAERARGMAPPVAANAPNGIKLLRVISVDKVKDEARLEVHFFNLNYLTAIVNEYTANRSKAKSMFPISGGSRLRAGSALGQVQVDSSPVPPASPSITQHSTEPILFLTVKPIGDYSTYTLAVSQTQVPGSLFDPLFAEISFKFRPGCFNTNCAPEWETSLPPLPEPVIDYTAKDYGSFRQTMIAAMMQRVPEWQATSEADLDMVLADLFSASADELSDYQDRVMNEAYLASARKRVSLARHSRLMDYHIHQGNQASTWLALEIGHDGASAKSFSLKPDGDKMFNCWAGNSLVKAGVKTPAESSAVFIMRDEAQVHQYLNNIGLYTWSDTITTLKASSTRADLRLNDNLYLDNITATTAPLPELEVKKVEKLIQTGIIKYLIIQEHLNPETGLPAGRDPSKRQILKLMPDKAEALFDPVPVPGEWFLRVHWEKEDKLQRDYCFRVDCPSGNPGTAIGAVDNVSLFHGNLIEVFHGRQIKTIFKEPGELLSEIVTDPLEFHYERTRWGALCRMPEKFLAYKNTDPGGDYPPYSTLKVNVSPGGKDPWDEKPSLIHSDDSAEGGDHFVVETDENRQSVIRFGNGKNGMELPDKAIVTCVYQYGEPLEGNVGADMIVNIEKATVPNAALTVLTCWNPFDVINGRDREPAAEIIRRVPEAYRQHQLRAVTLADYVALAEKIKGVSRAAARYAWTGSWRTVQVTIDPVGTSELSYKVRKQVEASLNAVRLIGEDLEIRPPIFVPLDIKVKLCASPDVWPEDIKFVLEQEFSDGWTPDGRMGFFHPDLWTFGQPLYASQIIGRALQVKGVEHAVPQKNSIPPISVSVTRWNSPSAPVESFTQLNHNEIIMVQNDPDHMERGIITFDVKGGRQ